MENKEVLVAELRDLGWVADMHIHGIRDRGDDYFIPVLRTVHTLLVFEEMSELQKELCRRERNLNNMDRMAEKIADVQIMLDQMMILHDCEERVKEYRRIKIERLKDRLNF